MAKLKNTNTKTLFELVGDPCSTSSSLGGSMFDYGEPPSLDESDNHKINERYKNSKSEADVVHGSIYEYVDVKMENDRTYLDINCKEHGLFTQRADTHIKGSGCPKCVASKGEKVIMDYFNTTNINYIKEYKIKGFRYAYDFYLPDLNIIIEYDGHHHFRSIDIWGGEEYFEKILRKDKAKEIICKKNGISLIRIPYTAFDNLYDILSRQLSLRFNYRVNGVFYKNIITLCKELSLSPNTSSKDLYEYNTYDQLMSMFKE